MKNFDQRKAIHTFKMFVIASDPLQALFFSPLLYVGYKLFDVHEAKSLNAELFDLTFQEIWVAPLSKKKLEGMIIPKIMLGYPIHHLLQVGSVSFPQKD